MRRYDRLEILRKRLDNYLKAEEAITHSQSYSMEGLTLTRANLDTVRKAIADLEVQIERAEGKLYNSRSRMRVVVPVDGLNVSRLRRFTSG